MSVDLMPCSKCGDQMTSTEVHTAEREMPISIIWDWGACGHQVVERSLETNSAEDAIECPGCDVLFVLPDEFDPGGSFRCTVCEEIQKRMESFGRDEEI